MFVVILGAICMVYKATKKDFELFRKEAEKWIKYLGLLNWEVRYCYDIDNDCRASCTADNNGRIATLAFSLHWPYKPKTSEIRLVAFHEVAELLLEPLEHIANSIYRNQGEFEAAKHDVIRTLENTLFRSVK